MYSYYLLFLNYNFKLIMLKNTVLNMLGDVSTLEVFSCLSICESHSKILVHSLILERHYFANNSHAFPICYK